MSKKIFNFVVILLLIVFISNFASPILNKSSSFQKVYAKSEDLDKETLMFYMNELNKELLQDAPILNDWRFNIFIRTINTPSMAKNYSDLCERAITLRNLASNMLTEAYKDIHNNDLVNANKHYQLANKYYMMSCQLLSVASQIAQGMIANTQSILDGVRKGLEEDFKFLVPFVAKQYGLPSWVAIIIADGFCNTLELFVAKSEGNTLGDTAKKELVSDAVGLLFDKFSDYLNAKFGIYDLKEVYFDSDWTRNSSLLEQLKYYVLSDKTLKPALMSEITSKGFGLATSEKIVDFFLSNLDSINSGSAGGGIGGGGESSWGQSLDKVQLSSPQNALVLQPGNINFSWNSVNSATKYEFLLYNYLGQVIQDLTTSYYNTSIAITFSAEGTFTWRVRAGDDYGNWGPWSDTWSVIIRNTSTQPYFKVLVDRGYGSTYKIGDVIKISGESNITANGTLYSYWSDGSVKTYPAPFMANQTVPLVSSPLDGATGLRRYKVVVNYQGQTYESNECIISIVDSTTTLGQVQLSSPGNGSTLPPGNITFIWNSVNNATKYEFILYNSLGQVALDYTTSNLYVTVPLGTQETITWKVRAGDNSGNWGAWSSTWSLTLKSTTTLGQVQLSSPGNGSTLPPGNIT
ncbi:hypothetical protein, partial [Caldisericum sp.]|uniref:hypothetical protein n=1 Tax=Caldisericum sp. TaxID=2499687 RepID=UPI003D0F185B